MNILVITQMYSQPDDVGDNMPTKTVNYFVKEWIAMGHKVMVLHCPSKFPLVMYLIPNSIKNIFAGRISVIHPIESRKELVRDESGAIIHRLPMLKIIPGQAFSVNTMKFQARKIERILNENGYTPEVVIGHFANPSLELVANVAEYYKAKSSIVFHLDCSERNIKKYRIKENINRIGAIGARSIIEADEVRERLNLNNTPFVCYSGAPNDVVEAAEKQCTKHDFSSGVKHIYVGSLIKRKHLYAVIKAFVNRGTPGSSLEVVGGGPEEDSLKALTVELHAEHSVKFTGRIPRNEVLSKLKEAQVFTLISDSETYGMVYIEAMLQGCIVIASKGGGFDGIIKDCVNGFICNPGDAKMLEDIYKRIEEMSTEERNAMGKEAIAVAIHFSERRVAENYLNDILGSQGKYK